MPSTLTSTEPIQTRPVDSAHASTSPAVARLTALWALAEVGLGGALHAFRLPLTGLLVGSSAVVLLALIAHAARRDGRPIRRTLLTATAIVLGVKAAASPHAPVGAYLAVAFQGGLASIVLPMLGRTTGPLVLGVVALAESAIQRVLVMTLLFGAAFWDAVDALVGLAVRQIGPLVGITDGPASASVWLVGVYIGLHVAMGIVAGVLGGRLPRRVFRASEGAEARLLADEARQHVDSRVSDQKQSARAWWRRPVVRRLALVALLLGAYALLGLADETTRPLVAASVAFGRAVVLVGVWMAVVAPLLLRLLHRWADGSARGVEVARTADQLPHLAALARLAWRRTQGRGLTRPIAFATLVTSAALVSPISGSPPNP